MTGQTISARPTKQFFVRFLTRDISLSDSILDLLDNCIDGVKREIKRTKGNANSYKGYEAHITANPKEFIITDNCGGITRKIAESAFRMGRPDDVASENIGAIGTYGIGMKRAIFKMGEECEVLTKSQNDEFKVTINKNWMQSDEEWNLPIKDCKTGHKDVGTKIHISDLHELVARDFNPGKSDFLSELGLRISEMFALIIKRGFRIVVNGSEVKPKKIEIYIASDVSKISKATIIAPYIYKTTFDGVDVELCVGLYQTLVKEGDEDRSKDNAGWTIICNERVVLYADKTPNTGWGVAGVPHFHNQFISIAGFVSFSAKNAEKLPLTTTKRDLDSSIEIYLKVKDRMSEGLKVFTSFTNKWKGRTEEANKQFVSLEKITPQRIMHEINIPMKERRGERVFVPKLPVPIKEIHEDKISFRKPIKEIKQVSIFLFDDEKPPSVVGERCFDEILKRSKM